MTVSAEFVANLEAARRALSHKLPGGELAEVLHEGLRAILANADRRRRGTGKKSSASMPPPGSRYVPAAVRDEVWRRDGGQCAFIGSTGHRCTSRHQLQLHHLHPFALGGPPLAANLSLRCRPHNLHAAEQDYGREHIAAKVVRAAGARSFRSDAPAPSGPVLDTAVQRRKGEGAMRRHVRLSIGLVSPRVVRVATSAEMAELRNRASCKKPRRVFLTSFPETQRRHHDSAVCC